MARATVTGFKVSGFKELYRNLDGITRDAARAKLEPVLVEALEPMRDTARSLAPDDPLTGPPWDLGASIEVSTRQRTGRAKSDRALGRFDARAYMGPTRFGYPQALFREFGHLNRAGGFVPATPYMRPAYDQEKHATVVRIGKGAGKLLNTIIAKHRAKGI